MELFVKIVNGFQSISSFVGIDQEEDFLDLKLGHLCDAFFILVVLSAWLLF